MALIFRQPIERIVSVLNLRHYPHCPKLNSKNPPGQGGPPIYGRSQGMEKKGKMEQARVGNAEALFFAA